jgi:hypothetical protein
MSNTTSSKDFTIPTDEGVAINEELDTQTELLIAIKRNTKCSEQQIELLNILIELNKQMF